MPVMFVAAKYAGRDLFLMLQAPLFAFDRPLQMSVYPPSKIFFLDFSRFFTNSIASGRILAVARAMDSKDLEILRLVQSNARLTADAIGDEIGLSAPAVQKRLKKLRETGVIEKEVAVISPSKVGREMTVIVQVMLERESRLHLDSFKKKMKLAPGVQQCYYTTGEADFIVVVIVDDIKAYEAFTQEYFFDESNVSKFTSSIVMDRVKVSLDTL